MKTKILSPLRRDGYKAGMIMMLIALSTMLLTTACSSEDDLVNNTANTENTINKGYALPVTVNATRGGDATRATFDGSKLTFGAGDKLFVSGYYGGSDDKQFAGMLEYDTESGKFSGTIYTQDDTYKTYEDLFGNSDITIATLLPAGYESYGFLTIEDNNTEYKYDDYIEASSEYTLATSKADGVAQFSYEQASTYSSGFALSPNNAILNFTITGLAANTSVNVSLTSTAYTYNITGTVPTDASGNAKFAAGIRYNYNKLQLFSLTVGGNPITLVSSDKEVAKGKIYNIARNAIPGALIGVFTINEDGDQVFFSKGNLQATTTDLGEHWTWAFAANQWDYIGGRSDGGSETQTGNNFINGNGTVSPNGTVDLFGWSTSATYLGIHNSNGDGVYSGNFVDWGATMGTGWCTLSIAEWHYLFYTRTVNGDKGVGHSYTLGQSVNGKLGVVLYPDDYTGAAYTTGSNWSTFESAGCVFLPAAGYRDWGTVVNVVTDVNVAGDDGYYWSSTADGNENANYVYFSSDYLEVDDYSTSRYCGHSVRLVRPVQ